MSLHDLKTPWRVEGRRIVNADGVPVIIATPYTSLAKRDADGPVFNTSPAAEAARVEAVVAAINAHFGGGS